MSGNATYRPLEGVNFRGAKFLLIVEKDCPRQEGFELAFLAGPESRAVPSLSSRASRVIRFWYNSV
jgi:hypothetical protein